MRVLFDTNVVLDVLLDRQPHAAAAARLMAHAHDGRIEGLVGATTVTTIHYLAEKAVGTARARRHVGVLLAILDVAPVSRATLVSALALKFADFEDAVLHEAAREAGAAGIVTRDAEGFARSRLPVYSPAELQRLLGSPREA